MIAEGFEPLSFQFLTLENVPLGLILFTLVHVLLIYTKLSGITGNLLFCKFAWSVLRPSQRGIASFFEGCDLALGHSTIENKGNQHA